MVKSVFFLGIVRSGTSFLGRLLTSNSENVYITHESDIIWILYNLYELGTPLDEIVKYRYDSQQAMGDTIKKCKLILQQWKNHSSANLYKLTGECHSPASLYEECQHNIMSRGTQWQPIKRSNTIYLGDKKPTQQSDPAIFKWTEKNFIDPKPKYIHLIRHPNDFLESTLHFGRMKNIYGDTNNEIMEFWVKKQQDTLKLIKDIPERVITVKYEDVCESPIEELHRIYNFLDLPVENPSSSGVKPASIYKKAEYDYPKGYAKLMKIFDYEEKKK